MTLKKASNILFLIAVIAFAGFMLCVFIIKNDDTLWRLFAVCMVITANGLIFGTILRIIDYIRKK